MVTSSDLKLNSDCMILDFTKWTINNNNFKKYFNPVLEMSSKYNWIQIKITTSFKKVHVIDVILFKVFSI